MFQKRRNSIEDSPIDPHIDSQIDLDLDRRIFIKRRPGYFRRNWSNPIRRRTIYRKNPKQAKECRCYACNQIGHYANECPNKFNKKKIELDEDIEKMINQGEFIQVRKLEDLDDIHSEESI